MFKGVTQNVKGTRLKHKVARNVNKENELETAISENQ